MTAKIIPYSGPQLKKYVRFTFLLHFAIIFFVILISFFGLWDLFFTPQEFQEVKGAVRVDVLALPKYTLEELRRAPVQAVKKDQEEQKLKSEQNLSPQEVAELEELMKDLAKKSIKMKPISAAPSASKENENQQSLNDEKVSKEKLQKLVLAGNKLLEGQQAQGSEDQYELEEFDRYILAVTDLVRKNWQLPSYLLKDPLKCRIQLFINESGELNYIKTLEASGVSDFDQRALDAIKAATPFPKPDEKIVKRLLEGQFVLGFPL